MAPPARRHLLPIQGALLALVVLGGGLLAAFPASGAVTSLAVRADVPLRPLLFLAVLALSGGLAGAVWAAGVARLVGRRATRRAALAGGAGYGLASAVAVHLLTTIETRVLAHAQAGAAVSMHVVFASTFAGAAFLVVLASVGALGAGIGLGGRAVRPALASAAVGGLVFLVVTLLSDGAGWRVGAPGAEARFTMVVVTAASASATLLGAGAAAAMQLGRAACAAAGEPGVPPVSCPPSHSPPDPA